jgi:hypothetical protein
MEKKHDFRADFPPFAVNMLETYVITAGQPFFICMKTTLRDLRSSTAISQHTVFCAKHSTSRSCAITYYDTPFRLTMQAFFSHF